jgi:hypothetical protein
MARSQLGGYRIEDEAGSRTLVVSGSRTREAEQILVERSVDGLDLNYAHGFCEPSLDFLDAWPIRRLHVLDRSLVDLEPIARLSETLEELWVQAAPGVSLDLGELPRLRSLAGEWELIRWQLRFLDSLERLVTWRFDESSLLALNEHLRLKRLTIKEARRLESLLGAEQMDDLRTLEVLLAPALSDIEAISDLVRLQHLSFETARKLDSLDDIAKLVRLSHLGIANSGEIRSIAPVRQMTELSSFYAWGTTRIADNDLSPLLGLTALADLRIRPRSTYNPLVAEIKAALSIQD